MHLSTVICTASVHIFDASTVETARPLPNDYWLDLKLFNMRQMSVMFVFIKSNTASSDTVLIIQYLVLVSSQHWRNMPPVCCWNTSIASPSSISNWTKTYTLYRASSTHTSVHKITLSEVRFSMILNSVKQNWSEALWFTFRNTRLLHFYPVLTHCHLACQYCRRN